MPISLQRGVLVVSNAEVKAMHLTVRGKQIAVGEALRRHVEAALKTLLDKYFGTAIEAHVVFSREAHLIHTEISLHVGRGIVINADAAANDYHRAFDLAAERLAKQSRRRKRWLHDDHAKRHAQPDLPDTLAPERR
jgi:ribosomal subunit interface protein